MKKKIEILQTRINELEPENKSLSTRLSKQEVRAKRAVSDKQEADLTLKKAEKRIDNLEHSLENQKEETQKTDDLTQTFKRSVTLTNAQSCDLLSQIGSIRSRNEDLVTVYLRQNESFTDLNEFDIELEQDVKYLMQRIESPTGMALFYDMKRQGMVRKLMTPPFPIVESRWKLDRVFDTTQLQELLEQNQVIGILLAHAGETFIGISDRERVIEYEIVRSSVKEKHTKGGWSQRRFERLRDEDIKHHADKARAVFEALVDDHKDELKMVVASGEHNLIEEIAGPDSGYRYPFPLLIRSIDTKAKIEKHNIDMIRVLTWSARGYNIVSV
ncbi:MAG: Vms1/Ankzf1 family peptidyl-tRNA hydrolase [Euryarchaeota archaeon]|nr:Vms1/Ankzf1 family peptidyl-tRNA hydrolase [Euryarchaeota archaeon]